MKPLLPPDVATLMTTPPITVRTDTHLEQAMSIMILEGIHCLPVTTEDEQLLGILSDRDLRLFTDSPFLEMTPEQRTDTLSVHTVSEIMQRQVLTIRAEQSVLKAAQRMRHNHIGGLPVVDESNRVVGVITRTDLLDFLIREWSPTSV